AHPSSLYIIFFFLHDPPTTEIYTLSLHDALPIWALCGTLVASGPNRGLGDARRPGRSALGASDPDQNLAPSRPRERGEALRRGRSEEHTSELQSRGHLVCRLLLEKKKNTKNSVKR